MARNRGQYFWKVRDRDLDWYMVRGSNGYLNSYMILFIFCSIKIWRIIFFHLIHRLKKIFENRRRYVFWAAPKAFIIYLIRWILLYNIENPYRLSFFPQQHILVALTNRINIFEIFHSIRCLRKEIASRKRLQRLIVTKKNWSRQALVSKYRMVQKTKLLYKCYL